MARSYDYSKMAGFIIDAMVFGVKRSCEMHCISIGTGQRWRNLFEADSVHGQKLRAMVNKLKIRTLDPIEPGLNEAIAKHIKWMHDAIDHIDKFDVAAMAAVRENYRVMAEFEVAHKMIDAKLKQFEPSDSEADGAIVETEALEIY